ncbi:ABC transporter permease, partial [Pyxidicoccus sp. 3LG]
GAGLLVRSAQRLAAVDPGYRPEGVTLLRVYLPRVRYDGDAMAPFFNRLLERTRMLPGVESAATVTPGVVSGGAISISLDLPDRPFPPSQLPSVSYRAVSEGAFATLGIPLRRGRDFTLRDDATAPAVVVVNESFARTYFPGEEVLGRSIVIGYGEPLPREVVGVVGDVRGHSLDAPAQAEVYAPLQQTPWPTSTLVVRSRLSAEQVAAAVKAELHQLDSQLPLPPPTTLEQNLERSCRTGASSACCCSPSR